MDQQHLIQNPADIMMNMLYGSSKFDHVAIWDVVLQKSFDWDIVTPISVWYGSSMFDYRSVIIMRITEIMF